MVLETEALSSDDDDGSIVRHTLHESIVRRIREMIIEGSLQPGMRLHEGQLGAQLKVSRTPLREALKALSSEGLLTLSPGRGAIVSVFSPEYVKNSLDLLAYMESTSVSLICRNSPDSVIQELIGLHDRMLAASKAGDRMQYFRLNQAIHSGVVRFTGNEPMMYVHSSLQAQIQHIRYIGHGGSENWASAIDEHNELMKHLVARNEPEAKDAVLQHFHNTWLRVKKSLEQTS